MASGALPSARRWPTFLGAVRPLATVYPVGPAVRAGSKELQERLADATLRSIPLLGRLYDMADCMVRLFDRMQEADVRAMRPAWCFFGSQPGESCAVLAPAAAEAPRASCVRHDAMTPVTA